MATSAGSSIAIGASTLHLTRFITESGPRHTENSDSSASATSYEKVVDDNRAECEGVWDPSNTPQAVGFVPGTKPTAVGKDGTTGKIVTIVGALVGKITRTRDVVNDCIRFRFELLGGTHTES